jgi:hypothetical protein
MPKFPPPPPRQAQIVSGRAETTRGVAHTAAERQTGDPHGRARAARNRDAMLCQARVHAEQARTCADGGARTRDRDAADAREVCDNDAVTTRVAGVAVSTGTRDDVDVPRASPIDDPFDIGCVCAVGDRARLQPVEARVPKQPRGRVTGAARNDHVAVEHPGERDDGPICSRRARPPRPRRKRRRPADSCSAPHELTPVHGRTLLGRRNGCRGRDSNPYGPKATRF